MDTCERGIRVDRTWADALSQPLLSAPNLIENPCTVSLDGYIRSRRGDIYIYRCCTKELVREPHARYNREAAQGKKKSIRER